MTEQAVESQAAGEMPCVDPQLVVALTLAQAEVLKAQTRIMLGGASASERLVHDLSPLGYRLPPR